MLTKSDLRIGMRVTYEELYAIEDTYVILGDMSGSTLATLSGEIKYITDKLDATSDAYVTSGCMCVFHSSEEPHEEVFYDE